MDMYVLKIKNIAFLAVLACFCSCGPIDSLLPSTGTYKVNANINGVMLDELSFIDSKVEIQPYFEESVSNDPDVTSLVVFLRNSRGNVAGRKVAYTLERAIKNGVDESDNDELIVAVKNFDGYLPVFQLPDDLPEGRYTLVSYVMSGKDTLQRIERNVYNIGNTLFSYDGLQVYMPGITENPHVIPKGMVVLLETELDFDSRLNPYIVWYEGRKRIAEGFFSDGAGSLLWEAPEQSGFYSLRAEVFPVENFGSLSGYRKEISLLVSSKTIDVNLITEDIAQLSHWYAFEGNLNDSKLLSSVERAIKPYAKDNPQWAGVNGTYGLVTGPGNVFLLPKVSVSNNGTETWQVLFRFKPLINGALLSVQFDNSGDIFINLNLEDNNLVLELVSSGKIASQIFSLPELSNSAEESGFAGQESFIKAGIAFSLLPKRLTANINIAGDYIDFGGRQIGIEAEIKGEFQIHLGQKSESGGENTAIWDEFALYFMPPAEFFDSHVQTRDKEFPAD